MFAEKLACHRVHLFRCLSRYVASVLALLVVAECGCNMARQMVKLMHKAIEELRRRGRTAYHQHTLSIARIAQPRIETVRAKVVIGGLQILSLTARLDKPLHDFLHLIVRHGEVTSHPPAVRAFKVDILAYHRISSQSINVPVSSHSDSHFRKIQPPWQSASSMMSLTIFAICASSSIEDFQYFALM